MKLTRGGISNVQTFKTKKKTSNKSRFYEPSIHDKYIFTEINNLIKKRKLKKQFYKKYGIYSKWDVYSLGIVFVDIIRRIDYYDSDCIDLINNMINIDFVERYNVIQCLQHPFLQK